MQKEVLLNISEREGLTEWKEFKPWRINKHLVRGPKGTPGLEKLCEQKDTDRKVCSQCHSPKDLDSTIASLISVTINIWTSETTFTEKYSIIHTSISLNWWGFIAFLFILLHLMITMEFNFFTVFCSLIK